MSNSSKNIHGLPTIRHNANFNSQKSAELLQKALEEKNKEQIIQVLCTISNEQRQEVAGKFKTAFGESLSLKVKKALSGDFEELILVESMKSYSTSKVWRPNGSAQTAAPKCRRPNVPLPNELPSLALLELPEVYDAQQMHKAMAGLGTKESLLIEILVTHSNRQIGELKRAYEHLYGHQLEKDIVGDTSGPFQHLLVSLCNESRDESANTDALKANQAARLLFKEAESKKGVNDALFNKVLATENFSQLLLIFNEYQKISGHSIEQAIQKKFSGDHREGFLAVVECVRNRPAFFAKLLQNTTKGFGTRDSDLIRLIVTRAECDLYEIKEQYVKLFDTTLEKAISGDCSGAYKDGLLTLTEGN